MLGFLCPTFPVFDELASLMLDVGKEAVRRILSPLNAPGAEVGPPSAGLPWFGGWKFEGTYIRPKPLFILMRQRLVML